MTEAVKNELICDIEIYHGFLLICFKRLIDGAVLTMEESDRSTIDRERLRRIMLSHKIITYNGMSFDIPLIWYFLSGASVADVKRACDQIINGNVKYWDAPKLLGIEIPRLDHIDLIEPQPNAFASLKVLNGRLHGKRMQDLPYPPDARLTHSQMDEVTAYCGNDLDATELVYISLKDAIAMREALGAQYRMDFRSKSDSQIGEAIIKKRVEQKTGQRVERVSTPGGTTFRYKIPDYMKFDSPELQKILERLRETDFIVQHNGKVDLPDWLGKAAIKIGNTTYQMGIGGLHSTEKNRSVYADDDHILYDFDVASYYPAIILGSGLYPKALGRAFLDEYRAIREERIVAKRNGDKVRDSGLKIALNGTFGKMGSVYSILYAPHLMIAVTLTGQLALLMLIERAEAAGIPVVSGNTDGVVFRCPRYLESKLWAITKQWEADTGFDLESTEYLSLHNQSVNTYIAVKPDGKVKRKGVLANPRAEGDIRTQLMNSPSMNVCADAAVAHITTGQDIEEYIRGCTDIRDFVTVVKVTGGGTWRGGYLGKVVRFIWSTDGEPIYYKDPHPTTGNYKKVPRTDGCKPVMDLPDEFPDDIDYSAYVQAAREILLDIGFDKREAPPPKAKVFKYNVEGWLKAAVLG